MVSHKECEKWIIEWSIHDVDANTVLRFLPCNLCLSIEASVTSFLKVLGVVSRGKGTTATLSQDPNVIKYIQELTLQLPSLWNRTRSSWHLGFRSSLVAGRCGVQGVWTLFLFSFAFLGHYKEREYVRWGSHPWDTLCIDAKMGLWNDTFSWQCICQVKISPLVNRFAKKYITPSEKGPSNQYCPSLHQFLSRKLDNSNSVNCSCG